jgi:hypothetical protein
MTNAAPAPVQHEDTTKLEVVLTLVNNVRRLKLALEANSPGLIYFFADSALGIQIDGDKCNACSADRADVFPLSERKANRVITNGRGDKAVLMPRNAALKIAIAQGEQTLFDIAARFDETK